MAVDDSYTKLLLHMDGADFGTTFTDETGHEITRVGNPVTISKTLVDCSGGKTYYESGHYGGDVCSNVFDNNELTKWEGTADNSWIAVDLGSGVTKTVTVLRIKPRVYNGNAQCKDFILYGSNNTTNGADGDWDALYSGQHANNENWETYSFTNTTAHRWYKLLIDTSWRGDFAGGCLYEVEICYLSDGVNAYKFATAGGYFAGDSKLTASSADFALGTDDFTWDIWYMPPTTPNSESHLISGAKNGQFVLYVDASRKVHLAKYAVGDLIAGADAMSANEYHHIAVVRASGTTTVYVDGVSIGSTATAVDNSSHDLAIGGGAISYTYVKGYIDEVRVSVGVARWTANFTPPTAPYAPAGQYDETNKSEILSASQSNSHAFTTFIITSLVQDGTHMDLSWAWQEIP